MTLEELRARREEILAIAEKYGASNIRVFGSVARGEADADSDVDFLVTMGENRGLLDISGLRLDLIDLLHCDVDIVPDDSIRPPLKEVVSGEANTL